MLNVFFEGRVLGLARDVERLGRLRPDEKVNIAIDMTNTCVRICADGIKAQFPGISEEELLERLRERIEWSKRWRRRSG